ncbi:MAG: NAD(P)H-dependent glycerol-3-phosphate dehydrogenase [Elusimicrobia bacterium]|nr:NAD(P)H-dependent glycerol-3-phosphate dehydrogenase [Elusimicrobiota bacterium]
MAARKTVLVTVLGAGLWGTVLANHLAEKNYSVILWEYFSDLAEKLQQSRNHPHLQGFTLNNHVEVTSNLKSAVEKTTFLVIALSSQHIRNVCKHLKPLLPRRKPLPIVINASKGIEPQSLKTVSEVIEEEIPDLKGRVFALSGPSFAREVARGVPTLLLIAGSQNGLIQTAKKTMEGHPLQVQTTPDRKGVELGGSLKNVLAIGCGILDGLRTGANTKAVFIIQGLQEIAQLIQKMGGKPDSIYGPAGLGDLIATGTSLESRNRTLGEKLGQGKDLSTARKEVPTVAEGIESTTSAIKLCQKYRLKAPLLTTIGKIVHQNQHPQTLLHAMGFNFDA